VWNVTAEIEPAATLAAAQGALPIASGVGGTARL
jgi:hypothetical protein